MRNLFWVLSLVSAYFVKADPLKVALYVGVGCRGGGVVHWARLLETSPEIELDMVNCADVKAGKLHGKDVLVMPGGGGL